MEPVETQKKLSEQKEDPIVRSIRAGRPAILVTGNFKDFTIDHGKLYYTPYYVYQKLFEQDSVVLIYSSSGGLQIFDRDELPKEKLSFINELLGRYGLKEFKTNLNEEAIRVFRGFEQIQSHRQKYPIVLVLDYVEHIAPNPIQGGNTDDKIIAAETIHKLANNPQLRNSGNLLIAIARAGLYNSLLDDLEHVEYLLPDQVEITLFAKVILEKIKAGEKRYAPLADDITPETFGRLSKGMKLRDCQKIFEEAKLLNVPVDRNIILKTKSQSVLKNSEGTLSIIETKEGFENIIGLKVLKNVLQNQAELLKNGSPKAARGILLMGPTGTGKSTIVKSLAFISGFTLVKFNQIKGSLVGQSEHLIKEAISQLKALAPCIIFIDEIELVFTERGNNYNLDGGVENYQMSELFKFMAEEENRGKILFVGATNFPQKLDFAMLSRFSLKLPVPPPNMLEIREHFCKCEKEVNGVSKININDPKIIEAAELMFNKGVDGRIIKDMVSLTDFSPQEILVTAKSYTGKAKRNDDIISEHVSYQFTSDIRHFPWNLNLSEYTFPLHLQDIVDKNTGEFDLAKSNELVIRLQHAKF